jgi:hypothetical protein
MYAVSGDIDTDALDEIEALGVVQLGGATLVAMMKAANFWDRHRAAITRQGDGARNRRVLV